MYGLSPYRHRPTRFCSYRISIAVSCRLTQQAEQLIRQQRLTHYARIRHFALARELASGKLSRASASRRRLRPLFSHLPREPREQPHGQGANLIHNSAHDFEFPRGRRRRFIVMLDLAPAERGASESPHVINTRAFTRAEYHSQDYYAPILYYHRRSARWRNVIRRRDESRATVTMSRFFLFFFYKTPRTSEEETRSSSSRDSARTRKMFRWSSENIPSVAGKMYRRCLYLLENCLWCVGFTEATFWRYLRDI